MNYSGNRNAIGSIFNNFFGGGSGAAGGGGALQNAQMAQSAASDGNQAATTYAQIDSEVKKSYAQRNQIEQETRTKVTEMFRDSTLNRTKAVSKISDSWVQTIQQA